jgi:hypothetical protein
MSSLDGYWPYWPDFDRAEGRSPVGYVPAYLLASAAVLSGALKVARLATRTPASEIA